LVIGLQQGLVTHLDNFRIRHSIGRPELLSEVPDNLERFDNQNSCLSDCSNQYIHPSRPARIQNCDSSYIDSGNESGTRAETDINDDVIKSGETFLEQSRQERKAIGRKARHASRVTK
jgi:hypothetical protein